MTVQEIFETEKRNKENLFDIHFYMEGAFWRAYEWSAYLSRNFPSNLKEEERLKVLKKTTKYSQDEYVQIGLQLSSFEKYFPSVVDNEEIFVMKNKYIIIHAKSFFKDIKFSDYEKVLTEWKGNFDLSVNEKKKLKEHKQEIREEIADKESVDFLIKEIISYPIENKTLIECLQFLSYIRGALIKMRKMNS